MLRQLLVPGVLFAVSTTTALSASTGIVRAVEECRLEPGWPAPLGSKWLSRINRDHHRCWFLSSRAIGANHTQSRRAASVNSRHLAGDQDQRRDSDLQAVSTPMGKTAVAAELPTVPQAAIPSVEQSSANLTARSVPIIAYRVLPTNTQTVLAPTGGAARIAERVPAGASNANLVLLAGAAGAALLFAGGTLRFKRQNRQRARTYVGAARHATRGSSVAKSMAAAKRTPVTTDPADDLKRSLLELKRDPKNVSEASDLRSSRGKGSSSSGAVSLPHAAAWLNRSQAKPRTEPVNYHLADA